MPLCEKCGQGTHNVFERDRNAYELNYVAGCTYPLPNSILGFNTNVAPYHAKYALGSFEPIDSDRKLAVSKTLPPGILEAALRFEQLLEEKRVLIRDLESGLLKHANDIGNVTSKVKRGKAKTALMQWHRGLADIQEELLSNKIVSDDMRLGIQTALYLKEDSDTHIRHVYFQKKLELFRLQLDGLKCFLDRIEAKLERQRRSRPASLSELSKAIQMQRSLLERLAVKYCSVNVNIQVAERHAYGLLRHIIPYSSRFEMPRIPKAELTVSVFSPVCIELPATDRILSRRLTDVQRDQVRPGAPKSPTGGIDNPPWRKEVSVWSSLAAEASERAKEHQKAKAEAEEAARVVDLVRNQRGPKKFNRTRNTN